MAQLLIDNKANLEAEDSGKLRPLHNAAFNGCIEIVQLLLRANVKLDAPDIDDGVCAVRTARALLTSASSYAATQSGV